MIWLWLLLLTTIFVQAEEFPLAKYYPLRLYGTNLYDFTPIIRFDRRGIPLPASERYFLSGKVGSERNRGVEIITDIVTRYRFVGSDPVSTNDLSKIVAAKWMADKEEGTIHAEEYLTMPPATQVNYRPIKLKVGALLYNCPKELLQNINFYGFALPLTSPGDRRGLCFDFGQPFPGDPTDFPVVFKVTPSGIKRVPQLKPEKQKALSDSTTLKIIEFQTRRADEGSAVAQFDLGMRYLMGDGVEPDEPRGLGLVNKAAASGNIRAQTFLESSLGKSLTKEFHPQP